MNTRSLIALSAVLVLVACAGTAVAPPTGDRVATTQPATPATPVTADPATQSEPESVVDEITLSGTSDTWTCRKEAPIGTRLPATVCRLTDSERDKSPGAPHPVWTLP